MLVLDAGNSRIKARCGAARWSGTAAELDLLAEWIATQRPRAAALSSVASAELAARCVALCERLQVPVLRDLAHGVHLDVRVPSKVGADRAWAARGASLHAQGAVLVVQVGTCLVVDAVWIEGQRCRLLGGAIAPGLPLLQRALAEGTASLPVVTLPAESERVPALGKDTEAACLAGVVNGVRGAARELCARLCSELVWQQPTVLVAGGDALWVLTALHEDHRAVLHTPELVLDGLESAAREVRFT